MQCPICGKNQTSEKFMNVVCPTCARLSGIVDEQSLHKVVKWWIRTGVDVQKKLTNKQGEIREASRSSIVPAHSIAMYISPNLMAQNARRLLYQNRLYDMVKDVDGDIVEFGVGVGETLINWCLLVYDDFGGRHIWGFDSFEGFPEPSPEDYGLGDRDAWKSIGTDNLNLVLDAYMLFGLDVGFFDRRVTLVKGYFEQTAGEYEKLGSGKIALLHLDCDLYNSYKIALEKCAHLVQPHGIIALDEFANTRERMNYPGAYKAVQEFLSEHGEYKLNKDKQFGKYYLVKQLI